MEKELKTRKMYLGRRINLPELQLEPYTVYIIDEYLEKIIKKYPILEKMFIKTEDVAVEKKQIGKYIAFSEELQKNLEKKEG